MNQTTFEQLELSKEILDAVAHMGFISATEIQAQSIPRILGGQDVIGRSQTGTGKTIAFGIPAIEKVDSTLKNAAQILIMCPTRELAMQACGEINKLSSRSEGVRAVEIYGGAPMQPQINGLKSANIVIGTPGRIMDHLRRRTLKLGNVKMVVLDEADEMLSMGFRDDIETILDQTPEERQTVLFSATMPKEILALTKKYQRDPQLVSINEKQVTVENISQYYYEVPSGMKKDALDVLIKYLDAGLSLVFCNTKRMVDDVAAFLNKKGYSAEGLHGDLSQPQRTKVMGAFKRGRTSILVATDVAARGIDVQNIEYVINYDIPQSAEYYVHRIGRTGRAGKDGNAITLVCGRRQAQELKQIGRQAKSDIQLKKMPTANEMGDYLSSRRMRQIEEKIKDISGSAYLQLVRELEEKGYNATAIASAALEMHFGDPAMDTQISGFEQAAVGPRPRYKRMLLNIGRENKVAPNHIVGAITQYSGLQGQDIGKIEILGTKTAVMISASKISQTIESMTNCKINGCIATASLDAQYIEAPEATGNARKRNNNNRYAGSRSGNYAAKSAKGGSRQGGSRQGGRAARKNRKDDDLFVEYC